MQEKNGLNDFALGKKKNHFAKKKIFDHIFWPGINSTKKMY